MIDGCLSWQREGLNPPAVVRQATQEYLASQDVMGRWLEDCCVTQRNCWTAVAALFTSWRDWCEHNQERTGSQKQFSEHLESRGFTAHRKNKARIRRSWIGDGCDGLTLYRRYARARA